MREKQQAAREQERQRHRTIESYCQDVQQRQEEFERKVREQPLPLGGSGVDLLKSIFRHCSMKGEEKGCEIIGREVGNQCGKDGKQWGQRMRGR